VNDVHLPSLFLPSRRRRSLLARWLDLTGTIPSTPAPAPCGAPEAILIRILSSDLTSSPGEASTLQHLRFILEHEPDHPGLQKRWLLNRIQDPAQRQALILLLDRHRQHWHEIRFDPSEYAGCWSDLGSLPEELHPWRAEFADLDASRQAEVYDYIVRSKHLYLRNRNGARNDALQQGLKDAAWVFPWDGDCLLTAQAWSSIRALLSVPGLAYLAVPAADLEDPAGLLRSPDLPPSPSDWLTPQFGFSRAARLHFDPLLREGPWMDHPLMKRLALPRRWLEPGKAACDWEQIDLSQSLDAVRLTQGGWTFRLAARPAGLAHGGSDGDRRVWQQSAIALLTRRCDMAQLGVALEAGELRCWTDLRRAERLVPELERIAARARLLRPASVIDKAEMLPGTLEPSRSFRPDGSAWQFLSGPQSSRRALRPLLVDGDADAPPADDRERLQRVIASVCALVLDGHRHGNRDSYEHACQLLSIWFIDPATSLLPDGVDDAAVEFRDLYPLLDAIVLLQRSGWLSAEDRRQLEEWFDGLLGWLLDTSAILLLEFSEAPGVTWHHLLMLAIACFRGRQNVAAQVIDNLPGLLAAQFRPDGSPRSAKPGRRIRHDHLFNLQAWSNLIVLCSTLNRDLWRLLDSNGHGLQLAFTYARSHLPVADATGVQAFTLTPLAWLAAMESMSQPGVALETAAIQPLQDGSSGLPPFWMLCRNRINQDATDYPG
jgi:hypothetical protein